VEGTRQGLVPDLVTVDVVRAPEPCVARTMFSGKDPILRAREPALEARDQRARAAARGAVLLLITYAKGKAFVNCLAETRKAFPELR
jgi:hypothetical protein